MNKEYWKEWLKAAGKRAIRTFAQAIIASIPFDCVAEQVSIVDVNWVHILGVATLMAVLSLMMSIAGLPEVEK